MWILVAPDGTRTPVPKLPATVGSGPDADVRLGHESILPAHARLRIGDEGSLFVDALADAYVEVGGWEVRHVALGSGDAVRLGALEVRVLERGDTTRNADRGSEADASTKVTRPPAGPPGPTAPRSRPPRGTPGRRAPGPAAGDRSQGRRGAPASSPPTGRRRAVAPRAALPPARAGLLGAHLSQVSGLTRWLLGAVLAALAVGLAWGVSQLFLML